MYETYETLNNGINYQPQLVNAGFQPSPVSMLLAWRLGLHRSFLWGKKTWNVHLQNIYIYICIYTWIFQACKICAFSPTKTYQKAEILHIWKIQVYVYIYIYTSRRTGNRSYFSDQVASSVNVSRPYLWWPWDLCTTRVRFAIAIGGSRSWESYLLSQTFAHTGNLAPNLWCSAKWNLQCQYEFAALASNLRSSNMCASSRNVNIPKKPICVVQTCVHICVASNMCAHLRSINMSASSRNVNIPKPPICVASNMCASSRNVNIPKKPICVASNMCASSRNVNIPKKPICVVQTCVHICV